MIKFSRSVRRGAAATLIGSSLALSGCGGGGDDSGSPSAAAPAPAPAANNSGAVTADQVATSELFISLVQKLVASTDDTSEPLTLPATAAAPVNDTVDPS